MRIDMPTERKFLCFDLQRAIPTVWYECVGGCETESVLFVLRETGKTYAQFNDSTYLGTFQAPVHHSPGPPIFEKLPATFVGHVYEAQADEYVLVENAPPNAVPFYVSSVRSDGSVGVHASPDMAMAFTKAKAERLRDDLLARGLAFTLKRIEK